MVRSLSDCGLGYYWDLLGRGEALCHLNNINIFTISHKLIYQWQTSLEINYSDNLIFHNQALSIFTYLLLLILSVVNQFSVKAWVALVNVIDRNATEISDVFLSIVQLFYHSTSDKIKCQFGWLRCMRSNSWRGPHRYGVVVSLSSGAGSGATPLRHGKRCRTSSVEESEQVNDGTCMLGDT